MGNDTLLPQSSRFQVYQRGDNWYRQDADGSEHEITWPPGNEVEIRADERAKVIGEVMGMLVDEEAQGVYLHDERLTAEHRDYINHTIAIGDNYRTELRSKLEKMRGEMKIIADFQCMDCGYVGDINSLQEHVLNSNMTHRMKSRKKELGFMTNNNELKTWKLLEVQKIINNDGFDARKKLIAIEAAINSKVILDCRYASVKVTPTQPAKAEEGE